jgi:hypothetical protein
LSGALLFAGVGGRTELVASNVGNNQRLDFDFWRAGWLGGFLVGREAVRRLVPLGRGTVIFTGASASIRGKPGFAHFSARPPRPACA